ncbi:MAG TPA: acyltransferase family protein [Actinomycetota bacterium]|jgi:peptidoglycan/LPS O-acetylase OafA/YrhL|nr:acyltransferase family protein [Actinomycetota bacterium]
MRARGGFRADVEGLRAVAVLAVVTYHAGMRTVAGGYVGVDIFYVLSGFLITGLLWDELQRSGRLQLAAFYARRARRLLPAAVLVLVVTVAASSVWLSPLRAEVVARDAVAAALYMSNYRFAVMRTDYLADGSPSPLLHYWSLGVEEQFYLLWPILLLVVFLVGRRRRAASSSGAAAVLLLAGAASFALSLRLTAVAQPWAFFSLPARAWELAAGGFVALAVPTLRRLPGVAAAVLGWLGLSAIVWSITQLNASTPFPGTAALFPVGGTVAVIAAGCAASRLGPNIVLTCRPLQVGGKLSYSWYLWHWPLLILAPAVAGHPLGLQQNLGLAAAGGVLALATVKLVEDPVRFSPRLRSRPGRSLALGTALTALAMTVSVGIASLLPVPRGHGVVAAPAAIPMTLPPRGKSSKADDAAPARLARLAAPVERAVARAVTVRKVPSNLDPPLDRAHADRAQPIRDGCHLSWFAVHSGRCVYGSVASHRTVMLFGDSHAAQWFPALDRAAKARRWRLVSLTKSTCPPVQLPLWSPVLGRPYRECEEWRATALQRIRTERPAVVVLGAARHYSEVYRFQVYGPAWVSGLASTVRLVRATGAQVVVLGPTPRPRGNVPDCLSQHLENAVACTRPRTAAINTPGMRAERKAVLRAGGSYIDVSPWICTRSTCAVVVGNLLTYRDDNHLSTVYAAWLSPLLAFQLHESIHAATGTPPGSRSEWARRPVAAGRASGGPRRTGVRGLG